MARLDTGWHADVKVLRVGLAGMGLHAWSISYCDHARTDGFVPAGAWPSLPGAGAAVKALLVAGLWERTDDGFRVHDYLDYNRSRTEIEDHEARVRERQSRHRSRVTSGVTGPVTNGVSNDVTLAGAADPVPVPVSRIKRDTPDPPKPPLADADAQGAPPTASARAEPETTPPKWEEVAPGQFAGKPNGIGELDLLTARCPRCERLMPVREVEGHDCQPVVGEPVEQPKRRGRGLRKLFSSSDSEPIPPEVEAELERMKTHRPTPEQIAAEVARLGTKNSA